LLNPTLSSATAGTVAPERRGEALGVQQSAGALGRVTGPLVAGGLFQAVGPGAPYLVAAGLAVVCLALVPDLVPEVGSVATEITAR
jgi:MFS transporter, DHA1 family, tetracycline resistance protein